MGRYVALLRGINVGGKNIIKMSALSACFTEHGYEDVRTYIQSGNVLFTARGTPKKLVADLEAMLKKAFQYQAAVVLRSHAELEQVVARAPKGFGAKPDLHRYDVLFLMPSLDAKVALGSVPLKEGVDQAWAGDGTMYFSRLIAKASASRLSKLTAMAMYQQMTIRNWNTTTALLEMLNES
jgi:uncharacterized protein (DUF1697 family)